MKKTLSAFLTDFSRAATLGIQPMASLTPDNLPARADGGDGSPVSEIDPKVSQATAQEPPNYGTSVYVSPGQTVPTEFAMAVMALEKTLGMPIWLLVQSAEGKFDGLDGDLV